MFSLYYLNFPLGIFQNQSKPVGFRVMDSYIVLCKQ